MERQNPYREGGLPPHGFLDGPAGKHLHHRPAVSLRSVDIAVYVLQTIGGQVRRGIDVSLRELLAGERRLNLSQALRMSRSAGEADASRPAGVAVHIQRGRDSDDRVMRCAL